jgi:glyoxylase-like metal-dependent hydrolase (beta-lactamase superfamily II)
MGSLTIDVYVSPLRPYVGGPAQGPGDEANWSPMSSTLIAADDEAVLVDALIANEQVDALADWIRGFGKRLTGVYITHGHTDHWGGLARLQKHFPEARGFASAEVVARARYEGTTEHVVQYWNSRFPGELPETRVLPEVMDEPEFTLGGEVLRVVSVGQGDTEHSTFLHVPSLDAVVAGDICYNNVHMMMLEADEQEREAWIASLDVIAALSPRIVVAGHKPVGAADGPENIAASQQYLRDFTAVAKRSGGVEELVDGMLALHGSREKPPHAVDLSTRRDRAARLRRLGRANRRAAPRLGRGRRPCGVDHPRLGSTRPLGWT